MYGRSCKKSFGKMLIFIFLPSFSQSYKVYEGMFGGKSREGTADHDKLLEKRTTEYTTMVNNFYDLVTDFYEWGWGECFHFAPRYCHEGFHESIRRSEYYLASRLGYAFLCPFCTILTIFPAPLSLNKQINFPLRFFLTAPFFFFLIGWIPPRPAWMSVAVSVGPCVTSSSFATPLWYVYVEHHSDVLL